jgi:hypothetical protein
MMHIDYYLSHYYTGNYNWTNFKCSTNFGTFFSSKSASVFVGASRNLALTGRVEAVHTWVMLRTCE